MPIYLDTRLFHGFSFNVMFYFMTHGGWSREYGGSMQNDCGGNRSTWRKKTGGGSRSREEVRRKNEENKEKVERKYGGSKERVRREKGRSRE